MAEDVTKHVETIFSIRDLATKPLQVIGAGAQKLSEKVNKASEVLGEIAGVASVVGGALGFKSAIEGAQEYVGTIKKIKETTGLAADQADGLVTFFAKAGVSAEETSHAILMMSKAGVRMENAMMGVHAGVHGTSAVMRQMGIDINKGPEAGLMKMAKLAKDGRLNTAQLMAMFRVAPETAIKMMRALKQGPAAMKETIDELKRRGIGVTEDDLRSYSMMLDSQNQIKESWERIKVVVGKELFPILSELLKDGSERLEGWIGYAKKFGQTMSAFLHDHLSIIMKISKALLLNAVLVKTTGKGMFEFGSKGVGLYSRILGSGASGGRSAWGAGSMAAGLYREKREFGLLTQLFGGREITKVDKIVTSIVSGFLQLRPILGVIGRLTLVTAVIVALVEGFMVIKDNVEGIRDKLTNTWENIVGYFKVFEALVQPVLNLFGSSGTVGNFFQHTMVKAISLLADLVEGMMKATVANIFLMKRLIEHPAKVLANLPTEIAASYKVAGDALQYQKQKRADADRLAEATVNMPLVDPTRSKIHYDFRNSRFDITQKFAEGFDPDRIAVAFSNDLAALGESKLQSQFSPFGSIR